MSTPLEALPPYVVTSVASKYLDNQDIARLSGSSFTLHGTCSEQTAHALLTHVLRGEEKHARAMIEANPRLLLIKIEAKDYSGRAIEGTAFQAALGAEDERMWKMMSFYFDLLEGKDTIKSAKDCMKNQLTAQFPYGIEETSANHLQRFYNALAKAINEDDDNGDEAIERFRQKITKGNVITSGKHFNMQHLIAAYKACIDNFINEFNDFGTSPNRDKFCQEVIGYVQRQIPANFAQANCSEMTKFLYKPAELQRTLSFYRGG
jgi:hypothetical protein